MLLHKYLVEFLGTMFIVFVILATGNYLAIGSAYAIAILLGGSISGGAFNPAVAIALLATRKITMRDILPYIGSEIAGALCAVELYKLVYKGRF